MEDMRYPWGRFWLVEIAMGLLFQEEGFCCWVSSANSSESSFSTQSYLFSILLFPHSPLYIIMPCVQQFSSFSCSSAPSSSRLQEETTRDQVGFSNNFNRAGKVYGRGTRTAYPYPRLQNMWIHCNTPQPTQDFKNLYLKVLSLLADFTYG